MNTAEKGGKGLRVLGKGERIKFYLDGLDRRFEVEPIMIEGLNHAVNFGIEFFLQQENREKRTGGSYGLLRR